MLQVFCFIKNCKKSRLAPGLKPGGPLPFWRQIRILGIKWHPFKGLNPVFHFHLRGSQVGVVKEAVFILSTFEEKYCKKFIMLRATSLTFCIKCKLFWKSALGLVNFPHKANFYIFLSCRVKKISLGLGQQYPSQSPSQPLIYCQSEVCSGWVAGPVSN